jgi:hypothetical protein
MWNVECKIFRIRHSEFRITHNETYFATATRNTLPSRRCAVPIESGENNKKGEIAALTGR